MVLKWVVCQGCGGGGGVVTEKQQKSDCSFGNWDLYFFLQFSHVHSHIQLLWLSCFG